MLIGDPGGGMPKYRIGCEAIFSGGTMFRLTSARFSSAVAVVLTLVVAPLGLVAAPAEADTAPAAGLPATVAADALPTAQIDGVAWDQLIVGDTVYVGGSFTTARPAGSPAGTNTVPRANMLAYKLSTGQLISSFAPTFDAQVKSLAASPDGSRIYAAGNFTKVNGVSRSRIVALDPATGAVVTSFNASSNGVVNDVVASASTVYLGGPFTAMNGTSRNRLAAVSPATGALQSWAPNADSTVQALVLSPDRTKVVVGGSFTTLNGSSNPGYGLGMVDATSGASLPMSVNSQIRDAGSNSAILSLKEDADGFYGSGYHFGGGGNLEGSFQSDWNGDLKWVEDCHGDTYDIAPVGDVVYTASPQALLRQPRHGRLPADLPVDLPAGGRRTTKYATGVSKPDIYGYPDHPGQPSPTLLNCFPDINTGTYTGKSQGPWTVEGNSHYLVYGGEFTKVNGTAQQGLVRFATKSIAPNKQGPRIAGAALNPTLNSSRAARSGSAGRATGTATTAADLQGLPRRLRHRDLPGPAGRPVLGVQADVLPGHRRHPRVVDPLPGARRSTLRQPGQLGMGDGDRRRRPVTRHLRPGSARRRRVDVLAARRAERQQPVVDWAGADDTTAGTGVTRGTAGARSTATNTASTFDGTANGLVDLDHAIPARTRSRTEAWVKTTSTAGGKIIGFGNRELRELEQLRPAHLHGRRRPDRVRGLRGPRPR